MKTIKQIVRLTLVSAALWTSYIAVAAPNQLQAIYANMVGADTELSLQFNTPIQLPKGFVMDNPPRIVFDFPHADLNPAARRQMNTAGVIHSINVADNKGRTRIVIRLNSFVDYSMDLQNGNRLVLHFGNPNAKQTRSPLTPVIKNGGASNVPMQEVQELPELAPDGAESYDWYQDPSVPTQPAKIPYKPVLKAPYAQPQPADVYYEAPMTTPKGFVPHGSRPTPQMQANVPQANYSPQAPSVAGGMALRGLDYRRNADGGGRLILDLPSENTQVDEDKSGNVLTISLRNVDIPKSLQQRMDVVDFATPISNVNASQRGNGGAISLVGAEPFTYQASRQGTRYVVNINKEAIDKVAAATAPKKEKKVFSGEKLSLNFQDIEVRAVLQLLADFTDKNIVVSDSVAGNITVRLKDVPWDQALDIVLQTKNLGMRESGSVIWVAPASELEAKEEKDLETAKRKIELEPLITEYIPINFAKAADLAKLIQERSADKGHSLLSERGSVSLDERTNTLLIQDTPSRVKDIRELIKVLDVPVKQVLIESRIVTASDEFGKQLGAKFGVSPHFNNKDAGGYAGGSLSAADNYFKGTTPSLSDSLSVNLPVVSPAGQFGFSILSPDFMLSLELSALQAESKGEIIATPRVITSNQTKAVLEQGVEIPYKQDSSSGATNIAFKKAVLSLEVTPQITPDEHITMDLKVNQDTVGAQYADVPSINTRQIQTRVTVQNGQTVVLGGVHEQVVRDDSSRVPVLGDLPMVGQLFRKTNKTDEKRELLVFVTPKIVDNKR